MGIQGLIPFLKKATRAANIKEFKGGVVAIDSYCWLHKGAFACAEKLALGEKTDQYVYYCMKYVNSLLSFDIKPIMVFDGCRLPSKKEVEQTRRDRRNANRKKAAQLLREGKRAEARDCLVQCVDITPEMALELMNACREKGVDCIVAPYEADAQLAYLNKIGIVDVVITEDSDLVLFGCEKIMFKMDINGNGLLVEKSKLQLSVDIPQDQFTFEKFRRICILSGCDYLQSLPGIGLAKATKVLKLSRQSDMRQVIRKIPSTLKMSSLNVPDDYADNFNKAENTFLYQLVFDPLLRKAVPLNPYPPGIDPSDLQYAGPSLSDEMAFQIAIGNINVNTFNKMASFDPDTFKPKSNGFNQNVNEISKQSIWSRSCDKFLEERKKKLRTTEDSAVHRHEEQPVQRSSTKGKEVTITVPVHSRRSNNHQVRVTEQLIIEEPSLPGEDELVKIYGGGGHDNSSVEDHFDQDRVAKNQLLNNESAVSSRARTVPQLAKEEAGKSTPETGRDRKAEPHEVKTPKQNGGPRSDNFTSPSKRSNVFALRSEERNGSDKKRFSLDGCPSTPKTETKCRFFDLSPEPVKESRFFVKLKQVDKECDKAVAEDETDIVDVDSDAELKSESKPQEDSGKNEVRSRLSAYASRQRRNGNLVCSSAARATLGSSKRSLFSLDKSEDADGLDDRPELESVPKKLKLDVLLAVSEQRDRIGGTPSENGGRRSIFAISGSNEGRVRKDDRHLAMQDAIPVTLRDKSMEKDSEPEDPLTDITAKEISYLNRKANDKASPASLSDEDPLSHMTDGGRSDKKNQLSKQPVFSLTDDFYEDERVLSDEGEAEDPLLPVRRSVLENGGKANSTSSNRGKKKEASKGCRPSGLSRGRGRPKGTNNLQQDDSALKQSSLSNFFRSNFALDKNVERFPPK